MCMLGNLPDKNYEQIPYAIKPVPFLDMCNKNKTSKLKIKLSQPKIHENDKSIVLSKPVAESTVCKQNTNNNMIYVCSMAFHTEERTKLALNFTDRVKIICEKGEYCLVENIVTHDCGYVPRVCLTTLRQFLNDMKYLNA